MKTMLMKRIDNSFIASFNNSWLIEVFHSDFPYAIVMFGIKVACDCSDQ
jgi:hypothetical protein